MSMLTDEEAFHVDYSKKDCFEAMKSVIESLNGFKLEDADNITGVMQINCPMSGYTWGELISVNLLEDGAGTKVKISSSSKIPSLLSKRKNAKNTRSIISKFSEIISTYNQVHGTNSEQKSEDVKSRLQKLKDLYNKSLISEDEYKSKKSEILKAV